MGNEPKFTALPKWIKIQNFSITERRQENMLKNKTKFVEYWDNEIQSNLL
jgi:hypothetical protein